MDYKLVFQHRVADDIKTAGIWYKQQLEGLEKKLFVEIKEALQQIKKRPFSFAIRYKKFRVATTDVFPYVIYFMIVEELQQISIVAILHNKQDSEVATGSR